jgi:hypothetical protein
LSSYVHIADTLLGRAQATEAVALHLGRARTTEIFATLDAERADD